jgi:3-oxoadipate enol-lactonase
MRAQMERANGVTAQVVGEGRSIVFLHSLLADRSSLDPVIPRLSGEFRLVMLDLPGFGDSERGEASLSELADRLVVAIRELCPGPSPILFGNGYGSFLALAAALRDPTIASALCLAGCGASFGDEGRKAFTFMRTRAREAGLEAIADVAMRRLFPAHMAERAPELVQLRRERFVATDIDVFCDACGILASLDLRDAAKELQVPLLACAGEFDQATPPAMAEELAALAPQGTFELIPNCAHVPTLQAPEAVEALLRRTADRSHKRY